jgi:hypothetical protein
MPRVTKPKLEFRRKPVRDCVRRNILRRLKRKKLWIMELWNLDDERDFPNQEETELEAKLDGLANHLEICWMFLRGPDRSSSVAEQRANLKAFLGRGDFSWEAFDRLDPATQATIANRHPGGEIALAKSKDTTSIERAVRAAIGFLGPPRRGRSILSDSLARAQFGLFLARAYSSATGKEPTRAWDPYKQRGSGSFRDFVDKAISLLPCKLRPSSIDGLVLIGIKEFRRSEIDCVDNPSRIWNIDERRWLGIEPGN